MSLSSVCSCSKHCSHPTMEGFLCKTESIFSFRHLKVYQPFFSLTRTEFFSLLTAYQITQYKHFFFCSKFEPFIRNSIHIILLLKNYRNNRKKQENKKKKMKKSLFLQKKIAEGLQQNRSDLFCCSTLAIFSAKELLHCKEIARKIGRLHCKIAGKSLV